MIQENNITILSTFASDKLINKQGVVFAKQKGGPAFYLKSVFEREKILFILKTGSRINVDILITKNGEFGKIKKKPLIKNIQFSKIKTPYLLISSIANEFNLKGLSDFYGLLFFDAQGYTRNGDNFGQKFFWKANQTVFDKIFCLKGTKEELSNIPKNYFEAQKQKILLVTKGAGGCEVFAFGERFIVKPKKVIKTDNTIGAGDTFFAFFVSQFIKTGLVRDSVKYAIVMTSLFLSKQKNHHQSLLL